VFIYLR